MRKTKSVLISTPYILWMLAFTLIPLGVVGYYALTDPDTGALTLANLGQIVDYLPVLWKSIWYSLVSAFIRSEERRVGKECRSRWSPDH